MMRVLALGARCLSAAECLSGHCDARAGLCAPLGPYTPCVPLGAAPCPPGWTCSPLSRHCVARGDAVGGSVCTAAWGCAPEDYCAPDEKRCVPRATLGASCGPGAAECRDGLACHLGACAARCRTAADCTSLSPYCVAPDAAAPDARVCAAAAPPGRESVNTCNLSDADDSDSDAEPRVMHTPASLGRVASGGGAKSPAPGGGSGNAPRPRQGPGDHPRQVRAALWLAALGAAAVAAAVVAVVLVRACRQRRARGLVLAPPAAF